MPEQTSKTAPYPTVEHQLWMQDGGWWVTRVERTFLTHHTDHDNAERERMVREFDRTDDLGTFYDVGPGGADDQGTEYEEDF